LSFEPITRSSTIDQSVTYQPELFVICHYHENYWSDHHAAYSELTMGAQYKLSDQLKKAFDRTNRDQIGRRCLDTWAMGGPENETSVR
jgi:hypothetical protein